MSDTDFYVQADAALLKALELDPANFESQKIRAWVLLGKHEFAAAREAARTLNRRMPDDTMVYGLLTDANVELGNYKEAEEAAQWLLNIGRASVPGLTRAAYLRELFGDIEGALDLMNTAYRRIQPSETEERAWILTQASHLLILSGKYEAAERSAGEALRHFPDYHYALAQMAKVRAAQGRYTEAVELLRKRCEQAPHAENLYDLGTALERAGQEDEAARIFTQFEEKAIAESKGWDNANRELIAYYAGHGRPADALRVAEMEYARRRDVHTLDSYAWALLQNGHAVVARKQIEAALAVGVREPAMLFRAAAIARAAGDDRAARRYAAESLRQDPKSEAAGDAEKLLAALNSAAASRTNRGPANRGQSLVAGIEK